MIGFSMVNDVHLILQDYEVGLLTDCRPTVATVQYGMGSVPVAFSSVQVYCR